MPRGSRTAGRPAGTIVQGRSPGAFSAGFRAIASRCRTTHPERRPGSALRGRDRRLWRRRRLHGGCNGLRSRGGSSRRVRRHGLIDRAAEGLLGHQHANSGWGTFDDDNMVGATAFMETLELALELRRAGYGTGGDERRLGYDLYPYTEDQVGAVKRSVLQWKFIDTVQKEFTGDKALTPVLTVKAGEVFNPDTVARRRMVKAAIRQRKAERVSREERKRGATGIREHAGAEVALKAEEDTIARYTTTKEESALLMEACAALRDQRFPGAEEIERPPARVGVHGDRYQPEPAPVLRCGLERVDHHRLVPAPGLQTLEARARTGSGIRAGGRHRSSRGPASPGAGPRASCTWQGGATENRCTGAHFHRRA